MIWLESTVGKLVAALGVAVMLFGFGWVRGDIHGNAAMKVKYETLVAQYQAASAKAAEQARVQEQTQAKLIADADVRHAQEMQDAQAKSERVAADLRAGNLRLREQWRGCEATTGMSETVTSAGKPDAGAEVRAEDSQRTVRDASAGRLVQYGAEADATIKALQAVVRADRGEP